MLCKKFFSFSLLIISVVGISCNNGKANQEKDNSTDKDKTEVDAKDDNDVATVSEEDIVGIYTISDVRYKADGEEHDVYDSLDYCQKHNTYGFNKGSVWYLGGVANQDCTGPDESGTWSLAGNQLTVNSQQSGQYSYHIVHFKNKVLEVSYDVTDNGKTVTYITDFAKQ
jgi:hypothetical protein